MNWQRAIEINRDALVTIVTRLFVLAGIRSGHSVVALPHGLRIRILALLRPAEFAARRLIAIAACKLVVVRPPSSRSPQQQEGSAQGLAPAPAVTPSQVSTEPSTGRLPAFPLFDPLKPYAYPWLEPDAEEPLPKAFPAFEPDPTALVDARALCRRILVLERALQDLEGQAARLACWRARRTSPTCRPRRWSPMRPGFPPGWRKRPKTQIEEVLKECEFFARKAWNTS